MWGPCCHVSDLAGTGERVYLLVDEKTEHISLAVNPADTLTQARNLYTRPDAVERIRGLIGHDGWEVRHNFHWGHMQAGFAWTSGKIDPGAYLDIWLEQINDASTIERDEWDEYYDWLIEKQIAVSEDREEFDRHFSDSNRQTATPRPGWEIARTWTITDAEDLDQAQELVKQVRTAYDRIRKTLGYG